MTMYLATVVHEIEADAFSGAYYTLDDIEGDGAEYVANVLESRVVRLEQVEE